MKTVFVLLSLLVVACSSSSSSTEPNLTEREAAARFVRAFCHRLSQCEPAYRSAFTDDRDCIDRTTAALAPKDTPSACTASEVDACVHDTSLAACGEVGSFRLAPVRSCSTC